MGAEQVLRAAACSVLIAETVSAAPRSAHERVAVISLGPPDPAIRQQLAAAITEAGLDPVLGDGVEDALAGIAGYDDDLALATATSDAGRAFGQLDCAAATSAAMRAIVLLAGRQAAGAAVPELSRAWTYVLLCADRQGE